MHSAAARATGAGSASAACASARRARTSVCSRTRSPQLGYPAATDGAFGPATRHSVRLFERAAGLRVDGVLTQREVRDAQERGALGRHGRRGLAAHVEDHEHRDLPRRRTPATPGTQPNQPTGQAPPPPPAPAQIGGDGLAIAPAGAPAAVVAIIQAGNVIAHMPYRFGGGHQNWQDTGYDCSGSVSYALHGAGLLDTPLASYDFYTWGEAGPGQWVTVYAKDSHAYMVVAGSALRHLREQGRRLALDGRAARARRLRRAPPRRPLRLAAARRQRPGPTASMSARSSAKRSRSTPSPRVSRSTEAMRTIAAESCSGVQRADCRASLRATNSLRRPSSRAMSFGPPPRSATCWATASWRRWRAIDGTQRGTSPSGPSSRRPSTRSASAGRRSPSASVRSQGGVSAREHAQLVDALGGDRLAARPQTELLDLARERLHVVAGELEQARERAAVEVGAGPRRLLAQPLALALAPGEVEGEHAPGLLDERPQPPGRHLAGRQQREHGVRRGRRQVAGERVEVGRGLLVVAPDLRALHHEQARAAEQAERVAGAGGLLAAHALAVVVSPPRGELLDAAVLAAHACAQPADGELDLGPVGAADQVDGIERRGGHRPDRSAVAAAGERDVAFEVGAAHRHAGAARAPPASPAPDARRGCARRPR